jgi:flagellar biosynthesis protein FliP
MIKLIAKAATAVSLILAVSVTAPAWSADKHAAAKCPSSKHKHTKRTVVAAKPQPARSIMLIEHRKQDVQILSFGP